MHFGKRTLNAFARGIKIVLFFLSISSGLSPIADLSAEDNVCDVPPKPFNFDAPGLLPKEDNISDLIRCVEKCTAVLANPSAYPQVDVLACTPDFLARCQAGIEERRQALKDAYTQKAQKACDDSVAKRMAGEQAEAALSGLHCPSGGPGFKCEKTGTHVEPGGCTFSVTVNRSPDGSRWVATAVFFTTPAKAIINCAPKKIGRGANNMAMDVFQSTEPGSLGVFDGAAE